MFLDMFNRLSIVSLISDFYFFVFKKKIVYKSFPRARK